MIMVTTGLAAGLSWVTILLPLFPAFIILFRKGWKQPVNACLLALCILSFTIHLILYTQHLKENDSALLKAFSSLGEWLLLFYAIKLETSQKRLRDLLNYFLISFTSVVVTIYLLEGASLYILPIGIVQDATLGLFAVYTLMQLVSDRQIIIFKTPLFWIAGSAFCYYSMLIFLEAMAVNMPHPNTYAQNEKLILLTLISVIRFTLLGIASST